MQKFFKIAIGAILLATSLASSAALASEDQFFGTLTGGAIGGLVGSQFGHGGGKDAAITAGVLAGGWAGNDIGYAMDNRSRSSSSSAGTGSYVTPTATLIPYRNNTTANYVAPDDSPSPESVYDSAYGSYCREYSHQVRVDDGSIHESYGTACLQPDGTWRAVGE